MEAVGRGRSHAWRISPGATAINLTIEAADPLVTVLRDTSYIVRMLREVNHPNLHGMLDLYCLGMCNETIEQALENPESARSTTSISAMRSTRACPHVIQYGCAGHGPHPYPLDEAAYPYMSLELMTPRRMPEGSHAPVR